MHSALSSYFENATLPLTVADVATMLGVRRETIYQWIENGDIPAVNVGAAKTVWRFMPDDMAVWIRERQDIPFRGPARAIADWMEEQTFERGGPRFLPPLISKALEKHKPGWLAQSDRVTVDSGYRWTVPYLMDEFTEAINKLPLDEQRQLLAQIKSDEFDMPLSDAEGNNV